MSVQATIVLFDVDGTLVLTGGAGRRAMSAALDELYGRGDVFDDFDFGGLTDWLIVRTALERVGRPMSPQAVERTLETYLLHLKREVPASDDYRVLPGVPAVLDALAGRDGLAIGLGTGNIRRGAEIKLDRGDLLRHFGFGGFGSDHEDRSQLLLAGARRGAEQLGLALEACRLVIVGDTPRDVSSAQELGATCVGVGTGGHSPASLRSLGAAWAFDDLTDPDAVQAILSEI